MIVRVDARVGAARLAEHLRRRGWRAPRSRSCCARCRRRPGRRRRRTDRAARRRGSRRRPRRSRRRRRGSSRPSARVGFGGGLLDEDGGGDEIGGRAQAADRKVLDGARGLHAVVRVGRDLQLAQRIALGAERHAARFRTRASRRLLSQSPAAASSKYTARMLPSFFDSVLQLIVRTSTDLPPDVRAAMKIALGAEPAGTRAVAGADDHRAEHRPRRRQRRRDLPGHRHADLRGQDAGRRQPDLDAAADSRGGGRSDAARQAAARTRSIRSPARTPATTSGPGTPIIHFDQWERDEIEIKLILKGGGCENTNAQYALPVELPHLGRADRTLDGVQEVHPARGVERAGQGLQRRARSASASAAIARRATCTRRSSCSARSTT